MLESEPKPAHSAPVTVRSRCPQCGGGLAVQRIMSGRAGSEYWTMRCTSCGGIQLELVKRSPMSRTN